LDWYLVVRENGNLLGMLAWDDMKFVARISGTIDANKSFHVEAKEIGVASRAGVVDGQFGHDGWITANIKGPHVDCKDIRVPWFRPTLQKL
jgi:hypothetical protein